jgi:quinol monooxygenase YgiN
MTIQLAAVLDIALTHTADFESAVTALAKAAATEPGVLDHGFRRDPTHPGRCLIRERYADQAAVDTHLALPDVRAGRPPTPTHSSKPPPSSPESRCPAPSDAGGSHA